MTPVKLFSEPTGKLNGNHGAPEGRGERFHYAVEVGAFAVHAGADDGARQSELVAVLPDALGDDLDLPLTASTTTRAASTAGSAFRLRG